MKKKHTTAHSTQWQDFSEISYLETQEKHSENEKENQIAKISLNS